jgi:hypothetical protein
VMRVCSRLQPSPRLKSWVRCNKLLIGKNLYRFSDLEFEMQFAYKAVLCP